jgi:hypothetical protein
MGHLIAFCFIGAGISFQPVETIEAGKNKEDQAGQ